MRRPIAIGKGSGFQLKRSGRRPCEDRMAVCGPGVTWRSPTERIGPGCRMGMMSPHRVGTVPTDKSPYGVMDGAGNVMEWVADWYAGTPISRRPRNGTRRALITEYFGCFVGGGMRPRGPIFASPAGARWFRTFAMKRSGFAVRNLVRNQRRVEREKRMKLTKNQSSRG